MKRLIALLLVTFVLASCSPAYQSQPAAQNQPSNTLPLQPSFETPSDLDPGFAKCLTAKGAIMYGAFWCSHCTAQKELFGAYVGDINYIECSTPDGKGQLKVCADAGIKGYPAWVFSDGTRLAGQVPLQKLSEVTGCPLTASEAGEYVNIQTSDDDFTELEKSLESI